MPCAIHKKALGEDIEGFLRLNRRLYRSCLGNHVNLLLFCNFRGSTKNSHHMALSIAKGGMFTRTFVSGNLTNKFICCHPGLLRGKRRFLAKHLD